MSSIELHSEMPEHLWKMIQQPFWRSKCFESLGSSPDQSSCESKTRRKIVVITKLSSPNLSCLHFGVSSASIPAQTSKEHWSQPVYFSVRKMEPLTRRNSDRTWWSTPSRCFPVLRCKGRPLEVLLSLSCKKTSVTNCRQLSMKSWIWPIYSRAFSPILGAQGWSWKRESRCFGPEHGKCNWRKSFRNQHAKCIYWAVRSYTQIQVPLYMKSRIRLHWLRFYHRILRRLWVRFHRHNSGRISGVSWSRCITWTLQCRRIFWGHCQKRNGVLECTQHKLKCHLVVEQSIDNQECWCRNRSSFRIWEDIGCKCCQAQSGTDFCS